MYHCQLISQLLAPQGNLTFWHHQCWLRDDYARTAVSVAFSAADIVMLVDGGADVNEVEAAGNTPLHSAAFEGWREGAELLLQLGAKVNASNNAGDTPWVSLSKHVPEVLWRLLSYICVDLRKS